MFEDPFSRHDVCARQPIDEAPGAIALECIKLLCHGIPPIGVLECRTCRGGNEGNRSAAGCQSIPRIRFMDASFSACDHVMGTYWCGWGRLLCRDSRRGVTT
jgi:hypothetical protein